MLDYELVQEIAVGETETVEVEMHCTEEHESFEIYRLATFKKSEDRVVHCPEFDCCISNDNLSPPEAVASAMVISESLNFMYRPYFYKMAFNIGYDYLRKYQIRDKEKLKALNLK